MLNFAIFLAKDAGKFYGIRELIPLHHNFCRKFVRYDGGIVRESFPR